MTTQPLITVVKAAASTLPKKQQAMLKTMVTDFKAFNKAVLAGAVTENTLAQSIALAVKSTPVGKHLSTLCLQFELAAIADLIATDQLTVKGKADKTATSYNTTVIQLRRVLAKKGKGYVLQIGDTATRVAGVYAAVVPATTGESTPATTGESTPATTGESTPAIASDAPIVEKLTPTILHDNLVGIVKAQTELARKAGFSEVAMLITMAETLQGLAADYKAQADSALLALPVKTRGRNAMIKRLRAIA